ncbi:Rhodanese-like protein [Sparassis latifolia]
MSSAGSVFGDHCPLALSPAQLQRLPPDSVAVLDASWHMPNSPRNARAEFDALRIPRARFLDLDAVASTHPLALKHMMPSPVLFAQACEDFGISPDSHVVLYDSHGVFSSPRALFMFRAFGHNRSSILDGGLPAWLAHGAPTESGPLHPIECGRYPTPSLDKYLIKRYEQIVANSKLDPASSIHAEVVLDARPHGRYAGTAPEPRPGLPSGHIPHSFSLPFSALLQTHEYASTHTRVAPAPTYTTLAPPAALHGALATAVGPELAGEITEGRRRVVASCGSGMTAGVVWLGLGLVGVRDVGLYDESWTGYAMREESEIVKGEPAEAEKR